MHVRCVLVHLTPCLSVSLCIAAGGVVAVVDDEEEETVVPDYRRVDHRKGQGPVKVLDPHTGQLVDADMVCTCMPHCVLARVPVCHLPASQPACQHSHLFADRQTAPPPIFFCLPARLRACIRSHLPPLLSPCMHAC